MIRRLGFYEVVNQLGKGGMGTVYLTRDRRDGRQAAVKVLHPEFREDLDRRARFVREARLGALVDHPNVVAVHEVGEVHLSGADRTLFLALEFVPGRDLYQRMSFDDLTTRDLVSITRQVALGLAAAHDAGVLHRDIKPGNVMVDRDGNAKLLDFGLAASIPGRGEGEEMPAVIASSTFEGTVGYAAPEQVRGAALDERSDIFSLGATLYHAVTGRPAYVAQSLPEAARTLAGGELTSPERLTPKLGPELAQLIVAMLRRDPTERPQSAAEVAQRLDAVQQEQDATLGGESSEEPSSESEPGLGQRFRAWVGRG